MEKTLRDEFAMSALQGWLASYGTEACHPCDPKYTGYSYAKNIAVYSYMIADFMLEARNPPAKI